MRRAGRPAAALVAAGRVVAVAALLAAATIAAPAEDTAPVELRRLFPHEAEVAAEGGGLLRLILTAEILGDCRPDLSDLRLFDAHGREVPFLVDAGPAPSGVIEQRRRYEPRILDTTRAEVRRDNGPPLRHETFDLSLPDGPPPAGGWVLVATIGRPEFVARARVEAISGDGAVTPLVTETSLFRLGGARPAEKTRLPLPDPRGARIRVTLETEQPFWLEPGFALESARVLDRGDRIAVPLERLSSRSDGGRTIVDIERPPGLVPDLLRVETSTANFDRAVTVWDEGPTSAAGALGSAAIFRVAGLVPAGVQEVAVRGARGERLRVEIEDGDSPALGDLAFAAVVRQPSLIFALPPAPAVGAAAGGGAGSAGGTGPGGQGAAVLRFGGGRAHPPRYDLRGLLPGPAQSLTGKRAEAAALLYDPAIVRPARLGATRPNPDYDGAPALAFARHPGAGIDPGLFSHVRRITVPEAPEGLSRLRLAPEDLAVLRPDLSDLRVADAAARQWPYLVDREAATDLVALSVDGPGRGGAGRSTYDLRPPVAPLLVERILLDTDAGYFDRTFTLEGRLAGGDSRTIARGRVTRPIGDPRPVSIDLGPAPVDRLLLTIEDADDAPLAFRSVRARVSLPEIYLTAPAGSYSLLMGAEGQAAPRYDLERVRDVVLAVKAAPIDAAPLVANPDRSLGARLGGPARRQTLILWVVLLAAAAILVSLTLRLARREPPPAP
jgi:hypothetical protein